MLNKFHPYHMVSMSPWPIISAFLSFSLVTHFTTSFYSSFSIKTMMIFIMVLISSFMWWKDVSRESSMQGYHQLMVMKGLKLGMILFIVSEILFFSSFFWAYFHSSLSPMLEIGQTWPPLLIKAFNPMNVPLLNTIILVSSGASVTWSHHAILSNMKFQAILSLSITCLLGVYFSLLQAMEYFQAEFSISDSSYGSSFFMATGFHGIHVLIGTSFLLVSLARLNKIHNPPNHIIGFELAAWYWHFVDVVWLFLYMSIYWWGN